jgi:hypothetical protein
MGRCPLQYTSPIFLADPNLEPNVHDPSKDREITLRNLFEGIEYVAQAQFLRDVTDMDSLNPSMNFIVPFEAAAAAATNFTLSVGG